MPADPKDHNTKPRQAEFHQRNYNSEDIRFYCIIIKS